MLNLKITDSDIFHEGEPRYILRISRYGARGVLFNTKGQVALMYMAERKMYKLPGGGIEEGETNEEAFMREIREETGYLCHILSYLGIVEEHKTMRDFLHISYCYSAEAIGKKGPVHLTPDEKRLGFKAYWFDIDEAISKMEKSISICNQYGLLFMLNRDKAVLEYVKRSLSR